MNLQNHQKVSQWTAANFQCALPLFGLGLPKKIMTEQGIIDQLRAWYASATLPEAPIVLNNYTTITNTEGFVEGAFRMIDKGGVSQKKMGISELTLLKAHIESV